MPSLRSRGGIGSSYREESLDARDLTGLWVSFVVGMPVVLVGLRLMAAPAAGGMGFSGSQLLLMVPVGVLLGVGLIAATAFSAAQVSERTVVLLRPSVGILGSWLYLPIGLVFFVAWSALELAIAGRSLTVAVELLGGPAINRTAGTIGVAVVAALLLFLGPRLVARTWVRWFAFWAGLAVMLLLTWQVASEVDLAALLEQRPAPHFWLGVDLIVGASVLFFPLVADTARFAADENAAASSIGAGFGVPALIALLLGGLTAVAITGAEPTPVGMVASVFGSAAGVFGGLLALFWVLAAEPDQPFAFLYSAAASVEQVLSRVALWIPGLLLTVVAVIVAIFVDANTLVDLLGLVLSALVPLLGVFLADFYVVRRRSYLSDALYKRRGVYKGVNFYALPSLILGFLLYQWIDPTGPSWWVDAVENLIPGGSPASTAGVPPVIMTLVFAFSLYALLGRWRIKQAFYMSHLRF